MHSEPSDRRTGDTVGTKFYPVSGGSIELNIQHDYRDLTEGTIRREDGPVVPVPPAVAGRLLCWATHPMALELGTIPPLVRCCRYCTLFPGGHPVAVEMPAK